MSGVKIDNRIDEETKPLTRLNLKATKIEEDPSSNELDSVIR
jgi:hypothetical protein